MHNADAKRASEFSEMGSAEASLLQRCLRRSPCPSTCQSRHNLRRHSSISVRTSQRATGENYILPSREISRGSWEIPEPRVRSQANSGKEKSSYDAVRIRDKSHRINFAHPMQRSQDSQMRWKLLQSKARRRANYTGYDELMAEVGVDEREMKNEGGDEVGRG
jgi:hypothetical protein